MSKLGLFALFSIISLALLGCAPGHGTSPKGSEVAIETAAIKFADDVKTGGYKVVNTVDLKKWIDEGKKIIVISALPAAEDKDLGRLPSAVNSVLPKTEKELTPADKDLLIKTAGIEKDKTIVIYCGFVACRRSHIGAKILVDEGFKDVYRYPAGITGWKEMGYPTAK
jgi:rhodanese-related sulfurtransferase